MTARRLGRIVASVWVASASLGVSTRTAEAQDPPMRIIRGRVTDSTGAPAFYSRVDAGPTFRTLADSGGQFRLAVPVGQPVSILFRRIGFQPHEVKLAPGPDTVLAITLIAAARGLEAMRIAARKVRSLEMRGFYTRMAEREKGIGPGEFITPEEIEMRQATQTSQLFDGRTGLAVRRDPTDSTGTCGRDRCWLVLGEGSCFLTFYLDGIRLQPDMGLSERIRNPRSPRANTVYIDGLVHPGSLAGIEIYRRGRVPAQYQAGAGNCGVVLIWTR